jgi:predicted dehydrogenase
VIRVGLVGCNYGRMVQLPAFRADPRCELAAIAGSDAERTAELARQSGIPNWFGEWQALVDDERVDAVAIATPPQLQPEIAIRALQRGKPIFVEKPLAADLAGAAAMAKQAVTSRRAAMIDFEFPEIMAWRRAKELLDAGDIGTLRHILVSWNVENAATRLRLKNWKTSRAAGGGVLGNFVCHSLHYLEWFGGPLEGLTARLFGLPGRDGDEESTAALSFSFRSGAGGSLTMSCASYAGSGHRVELYGEDGTIMLINEGTDYMRGFRLLHARRPGGLVPVPIQDPLDEGFADGRIAPVARLASRFIDAITSGVVAMPGLAEGYRVQQLMEAAQRSHDLGRWLDVSPEGLA